MDKCKPLAVGGGTGTSTMLVLFVTEVMGRGLHSPTLQLNLSRF